MTRFVAELGSNHNGDLGRAMELVDACADAGADAVKIQVFRIDDLFAAEILEAREDLRDRRDREFPLELLEPLANRCHERGMEFGAAPFGLWAVEAVAAHVDFLKVASYELLWHELIRACASVGKPLVLSTGMADHAEIDRAVDVAAGTELSLLHCVSGYPTPETQCNLSAIGSLRERNGCPVGWSDHSGSATIVERAARRWDAHEIEIHVDLPDNSGLEAGEHNWAPEDLASVIRSSAAEPLDDADPSDGDGVKRPMPAEAHDVPWRADPSDGLRPLLATREEFRRATR